MINNRLRLTRWGRFDLLPSAQWFYGIIERYSPLYISLAGGGISSRINYFKPAGGWPLGYPLFISSDIGKTVALGSLLWCGIFDDSHAAWTCQPCLMGLSSEPAGMAVRSALGTGLKTDADLA